MKYKIVFGVLIILIYFVACNSPERPYSPPPKEIEQAVKEFFIQRGDQLTDIRASKQSDEIYLIRATSLKGEGWGLVAHKIQQNGQVDWRVDVGTKEKLEELGVDPSL